MAPAWDNTHMPMTGGTQADQFALHTGAWSWLCLHTTQELPVHGQQSIFDFKAFPIPSVSQLVS